MRIGILTAQLPFIRGAADLQAAGLRDAFRREGFEAEVISLPFAADPRDVPDQILACKLLDITESCGAPIDMVVGLEFPAYLIPHRNKVLWIVSQYRGAYDLWGKPGGLHSQPGGLEAAKLIQTADHSLFQTVTRIFANSRNGAGRLRRFCDVAGDPLYHPPPKAGRFSWLEDGGFLLMPAPIDPANRHELVIDALALVRQDIKCVIAGTVEDDGHLSRLKRLAAGLPAGRIEWLGAIPDTMQAKLFGECLAVVTPEVDADYGYETLQAMLASKPVIACRDSGTKLEFVIPGETGIVCQPEAQALAEAMDSVWADRLRARKLGRAARSHFDALDISWENVVARLIS